MLPDGDHTGYILDGSAEWVSIVKDKIALEIPERLLVSEQNEEDDSQNEEDDSASYISASAFALVTALAIAF